MLDHSAYGFSATEKLPTCCLWLFALNGCSSLCRLFWRLLCLPLRVIQALVKWCSSHTISAAAQACNWKSPCKPSEDRHHATVSEQAANSPT